MTHSTVVLDPDGDMIIILRNASPPFAPMREDATQEDLSHGDPDSHECDTAPSRDIAPEKPGIEEVSSEGTLEQQVDNELRDEVHFQVSAKSMVHAFSFFETMLGGRWKESTVYQEKGSTEITAEGWDSNALLILLQAVHCQYGQDAEVMTLEMLAKIALIADYYDLKSSLRSSMADSWIKPLDEKFPMTYSRDLVLWIWVSWVFNLPSRFKRSTSFAMTYSDDLINGLEFPIPNTIIETMNEMRQESIDAVFRKLDKTSESLLDGTRGCHVECQLMMYGVFTVYIRSTPLLSPRPTSPFLHLSYNNLIDKVLLLTSPDWSDASFVPAKRGRHQIDQHCCEDSRFTFLLKNLMYRDWIGGLDIDMFRPL